MTLSEQGKVVAYTDHLDECHKISDHLTDLIREAIEAMKREAAIWQPRPTPKDWP